MKNDRNNLTSSSCSTYKEIKLVDNFFFAKYLFQNITVITFSKNWLLYGLLKLQFFSCLNDFVALLVSENPSLNMEENHPE